MHIQFLSTGTGRFGEAVSTVAIKRESPISAGRSSRRGSPNIHQKVLVAFPMVPVTHGLHRDQKVLIDFRKALPNFYFGETKKVNHHGAACMLIDITAVQVWSNEPLQPHSCPLNRGAPHPKRRRRTLCHAALRRRGKFPCRLSIQSPRPHQYRQ